MFSIAVQTAGLAETFGLDGAYRMIKEAGFDGADAGFNQLFPPENVRGMVVSEAFRPGLSEKETLEYFKPYRDAAKKYGVDNYQGHAPYPSMLTAKTDPEWNEYLMEVLRRTIVGSAYAGCRNLIIHPFQMDYKHLLTREEEHEINVRAYMRLAETAKACGVVIHLENLYVSNRGRIMAGVCNEGRAAAELLDELNGLAGERRFGFCLDVGHALLAGLDIRRFMTDLGERIGCFHVHDNDGVRDQHHMPYSGILDWDRFIDGLRLIRFDRTLSFETFRALQEMDRELVPDALRFIAACGRTFARRAGEEAPIVD